MEKSWYRISTATVRRSTERVRQLPGGHTRGPWPTASEAAGRSRQVLEAPTTDVKEFERKRLLERIEREGATVGAEIPDRIEVQGRELELQAFIFELRSRDRVPQGERERVEEAKRNLRRERLQRKQRIEEGDITREAGERLAESIIGLDRALNEIENLGPVDIEAEARAKETADRKRWNEFLNEALGHEDDSHGVHGGR